MKTTLAAVTRCALLTLTVISAAPHARAQDVTIAPHLHAGDQFTLEVAHTRKNSSRPQLDGTSRVTVDVRVLSSNDEGFLIEWVPGNASIDNAAVANDPVMRSAAQAVRDMRFRLKLAPDGELTGLANEEEVAPKLQSMADTLVKDLSSRLPAEQRAGFLSLVKQVLSPPALIASATDDASMYFGLNGISLEAGEEVEADIEVENVLGTGTIPATFRVEMLTATATAATLETTTTYDAEVLRSMTLAIVKKAGASIPPEELEKLPSMKMVDEGHYTFDRASGLMKEIELTRGVSMGEMVRSDSWRIRLVSPPRR